MRAVVVVKNGRIVGERYGEGFSAETPLLGWSMTKTVTAAIIGTVIEDGKMTSADKGLLAAWTDGRAAISVADLMAMSSGLEFNEEYGDVTDVTRMLYLEPDMAGFAAVKAACRRGRQGLLLFERHDGDAVAAVAGPGRRRDGARLAARTAVRADRHDQRGHGDRRARHLRRLLLPLRHGARLGALRAIAAAGRRLGRQADAAGRLCRNGCASRRRPRRAIYGRGQLWLQGPEGAGSAEDDPDAGFGLPDDAYWLQGHDGQTIAIVPSKRLVVVRMGLTPSQARLQAAGMVAALVKATGVGDSWHQPARFTTA